MHALISGVPISQQRLTSYSYVALNIKSMYIVEPVYFEGINFCRKIVI